MIRALKNIAIILLLAAFLLPASGMLVFIHHCQSMGITLHSFDGSNSCCRKDAGLFRTLDQNVNLSSLSGAKFYDTFISEKPCCSDSQLFIKINQDYLSSFYKTFQANILLVELPDFTHIRPAIYSLYLRGSVSDIPDPPGTDTYLFTSTFRL